MKKLPVFLLVFLLLPLLCHAGENEDYISRLQKAVGHWQDDLPALKKSAMAAATKIIAGGNLYVFGVQQSFIQEALGRSGGMMLTKSLTAGSEVKPNDVILAAWINAKDVPEATARLQQAAAIGAQVILFSGTQHPDIKGATLFPTLPPKAPAVGPSVESVNNVIGMWAWTGEFITACIRQGKMPCMFESNSMPGALARNALIRKSAFHSRNIAVEGEIPNLGKNYLEIVSQALPHLKEKNAMAFGQAADLLRASHKENKPVTVFSIAHMFPSEMQSNPVPEWITAAPPKTEPLSGSLPLYIGYQWFPWEIASLTGKDRIPSIITSSTPPTPDWVKDREHVYIGPCWEVQDAAVKLPGYDIMILPVSGVMQSAIFWELIEKATR